MVKVYRKNRLVYGVGINDANYKVQHHDYWVEGGKRRYRVTWTCPYYSRWKGVLNRCYLKTSTEKHPTYKDCSVCEEWLTFSNFKDWMEKQEWKGNQLDKDLLVKGNKIYCPKTCIFIDPLVNTFIVDSRTYSGKYLTGCCLIKSRNKFMSQCSNPFTKKRETLGYYETQQEAHEVWKNRKHELACQLADSKYVTDERVAGALRTRYL